ncbi:MAG: Hpt domain-containing protein [Nitrospirota bacterium]
MADLRDDPFLDEVLQLFAAEARDWLGQIREALQALEGNPGGAQSLSETIRRGLTNLAGSAATVELAGLEQLALALVRLSSVLPGLESGTGGGPVSVLREGLGAIENSVQQIEARTAPAVDFEPLMRRIAEAGQGKPPAPPAARPEPGSALHAALLDLQRSQIQAPEPGRDVLGEVLEALGEGVTQETVLQRLRELDGRDREFLTEAEFRLPRIQRELSSRRPGQAEGSGQSQAGDGLLSEVVELRDKALEARSEPVALFLDGLHGFLSIAKEYRAAIAPQRYDSVGSRLAALLQKVRQWAEQGQAEREAIEKFLHQRQAASQ